MYVTVVYTLNELSLSLVLIAYSVGMQEVKGGGGIRSSEHKAGRGGKGGGGGGLGAGAIVGETWGLSTQ